MNTLATLVKPGQEAHLSIVPEIAQEPDISGMLEHLKTAGQLKESSLKMYKRDIAAYMVYAQEHQYSPVDPTTLENWRDALISEGKSPNTINRELAAVKRIVKEAAKPRYRLIDASTAYAFEHVDGASMEVLSDRLKDTKSIPLRKSKMQTLCNLPETSTLIGLRDRALLWTLATSGIRASEVAGLLVSRVFELDDGGYKLQVKGKRNVGYRDANLSPLAYQHIQEWLQQRGVESEYVFSSFQDYGKTATAGKLSAKAIWDVVKEYAKQVPGMEHMSPHSFRYYVGTEVTRKSGIRTAQITLGHKSMSTTQLYDIAQLTVGATDSLL